MSVYGVTVADIAAEIPGLVKTGFSAATVPTAATVQQWIDAADDTVYLRVQDIVGAPPAITDRAASIAKQYIINAVVARVVRALYIGRVAPDALNASGAGYFAAANALLTDLTELGAQASGLGLAASRLVMGPSTPTRDLMVDDSQLNDASPRWRAF